MAVYNIQRWALFSSVPSGIFVSVFGVATFMVTPDWWTFVLSMGAVTVTGIAVGIAWVYR